MELLASLLGHILKHRGIQNYQEWSTDIDEAIKENRFEWFYKNNECVGFFTWVEKFKDGKQYVYVGNLFIEPEHRALGNVLKIRKYMKNKFPQAEGYWVNTKKKQFVYE